MCTRDGSGPAAEQVDPRSMLIIGVQLLDKTKPHMEQLAATTENSKSIDARAAGWIASK